MSEKVLFGVDLGGLVGVGKNGWGMTCGRVEEAVEGLEEVSKLIYVDEGGRSIWEEGSAKKLGEDVNRGGELCRTIEEGV